MSSAMEIAKALRADILEGKILPGEELRQEQLAIRFKVSRMPIRDALNVLSRERLITLRPNRGGQVVNLSRREIDEIYDLRILLEQDALERSFDVINDEIIKKIKLEMRRCEVEADTPDFPRADWRFHKALYAPAGRVRQLSMIKELREVCQVHEAAYASLQRSSARWSKDHRLIAGAVEHGKIAEAKAALAAHLIAARNKLLDHMDVDDRRDNCPTP